MSRRSVLLEEMGLGPDWQAKATWFGSPQPTQAEPSHAQARLAELDTRTIDVPATPALPSARPTEITAPATSVLPDAALPSAPLITWEVLQQSVANCTRCQLSQTRTQAVFGRGNPHARWLLIGEAPGEQEDKQGEPFVGKAGQLLDNILLACGLDRNNDVYIANVLKCRPPGNRNPSRDEISCCQNYLAQQIQHIQPTLIVALGRFAVQTLLNTDQSIGKLRGTLHQYQGIPLIATFHPAYLLRNLPDKSKAWQDFVFAKRTYQQLSAPHHD